MKTITKTGNKRGLASADIQTRKRVASLGGLAAHRSGNAHEFNSEEARAAGRKGGLKVSQNRAYMSMIGRKGGTNSTAKANDKNRKGNKRA